MNLVEWRLIQFNRPMHAVVSDADLMEFLKALHLLGLDFTIKTLDNDSPKV